MASGQGNLPVQSTNCTGGLFPTPASPTSCDPVDVASELSSSRLTSGDESKPKDFTSIPRSMVAVNAACRQSREEAAEAAKAAEEEEEEEDEDEDEDEDEGFILAEDGDCHECGQCPCQEDSDSDGDINPDSDAESDARSEARSEAKSNTDCMYRCRYHHPDEDSEDSQEEGMDQDLENAVYMEEGLDFKSINFWKFRKPFSLSARKGKALAISDDVIRETIAGSGMSLEQLVQEFIQYLDKPYPRTIIARCTFPDDEPIFVFDNYENPIFDLWNLLVTQLSNSDKLRAQSILHPAPNLGNRAHGPLFNYNLDTLSLEYERCGGYDQGEAQMYNNTFRDAIFCIAKHTNGYPRRFIRHIQATFCYMMIMSPLQFVGMFEKIDNLKKITFFNHVHGHGRGEDEDATVCNDIEDLEDDDWPFQIAFDNYLDVNTDDEAVLTDGLPEEDIVMTV